MYHKVERVSLARIFFLYLDRSYLFRFIFLQEIFKNVIVISYLKRKRRDYHPREIVIRALTLEWVTEKHNFTSLYQMV